MSFTAEVTPSRPAEPVVALVLPIASGIVVGHEDGGDVLRILEAELGGYAQLHRKAVFGRQRLVAEIEGKNGLRVQRGRHVEAGVISVGAFEADIARAAICPDAGEEKGERHA